MRMNKYNIRKYILSALFIVFMACALFGYALFGNNTANALSQVPSSTTVKKQIYDFDNYCYSQDALNELAKSILANQQGANYGTNATFDNLISYAGTAGNNGRPITNKSITLKYGRYRFTEQSTSYNDLVWMPVYISTNRNGEAILTLYLAATETYKGTSQQEAGFFTAQGLYSTQYDIGAPSNLYGASHMRSVSLGAKEGYATYPSGSYQFKEKDEVSITQANCNKFSDFIVGTNFKGALVDDLATPSEMRWQERETFAEYASGFTASGYDTKYANYCWPNEAYGTPQTGSNYYLPGYFDYGQLNRTQYNDWQNDKVWLPSLTEVGDGDRDPNGLNDTTSGIWKLTLSQRSNTQKSWLRTAKTDSAKITDAYQNKYSTYTMFCLDTDGSVSESDVNANIAIRPAIHLNLSKIKGKTIPAVKLPEVFTSTYNGNGLGQTMADVPADQKTWYDSDAMDVNFYSDKNCTRPVAAIDSGTYYALVTLKGTTNKRFFGEEDYVTSKTTMFVIEKIKLGVKWTYNADGTPLKVEFADGTDFYERDKNADNIPQIKFYYKNIMNVGTFYDYPDEKGDYRAYAYIVDEGMYRYNYELIDNPRSEQFHIGERILPLPEFIYGANDEINAAHTELILPYKGKNFVQIKNISKQMKITVNANSESALKKLVDLGVNDEGVQTYIVEDVGRYTFTVRLSEKEQANAMWEGSTINSKDLSEKTLVLSIERASITVTFEGLLSSWDTKSEMSFHLGMVGIQAGDAVNMRVYYQPARGGNQIDLKPDASGKYTVPSGRNEGEYTMVAAIADSTGPYKMDNGWTTQKFTITKASSTFGQDLVVWQYSVNGQTRPLNDVGSGNTSNKPVELNFVDNYYLFSLTLPEDRLQQTYYVQAKYSGDTYVMDAGTYSITVKINAYDQNVSFEEQTYTLYFKINKVKLDVSGVSWNYSAPFKHTGGECQVLLNNVPSGLTVNYSGNKATNSGTYSAEATFSVTGEYSKNYEAPEDKLTLNWEISDSGTVTPEDIYDTSNLKLIYTHRDEIIYATWNNEQKKWFTDDKEFVLSFPYDGEAYTIDLIGAVDGLTLGTPSNNSFTNAGTYTANFNITADAGKTVPDFDTVSWTIEKAQINFDNVRWGYIDSYGNEYEIDFVNNPFVFTRNESGPVKFTVALINLPEGINISYSTVCLTKANSSAVASNSFSEAGDYRTTFSRTINFSDPNYVTVNAIPAFIPSFQYWKIQERQFSQLSYDGSWKEFDNRTHDLIELCGMTRDELDYFRVEIAFLDGGNNLVNYYEGYDGVQYAAYHAGTYLVRFFELRGDNETEYFWGSVEITVGKEKLEVTWDTKGSIYVARVTGLYVSEMIGTKYTTESGSEVKAEYIRTTDGMTFYAEPYLIGEYTNDIEIVMASGQDKKKEFTYWLFQHDSSSTTIGKDEISLRFVSKEYTGDPITFELANWDYLSYYLYYTGDSLTQTAVGKYSIEINFIKYDPVTGNGNAYWDGTDDDRSPITLNFEITKPSTMALEYPKLNMNSAAYTGSPIEFKITNWAVLKDYLTYEVTLGSRNFGQQLTHTAAGDYAIVFRFLSDSIGYWRDNPDAQTYTLSFRIIDPGSVSTLPVPRMTASSIQFTGNAVSFTIVDWDYYSGYCTLSGDSLTQTAVGRYNAVLTIKDEFGDLLFANGSRTYTLTFYVSEGEQPSGPKQLPLPVISEETKEFTGDEIAFVDNWSELSQYVEISGHIGWQITQKQVGEYEFYLKIKDEYKNSVVWADGSEDEKLIRFRIIPATVDTGKIGAGSDGKLTAPNGDTQNVNFDDYVEYRYFDKDGKEVSEDELVDGTDYIVSVTLRTDKMDEFRQNFANADEIAAALRSNSFEFTYDSGEEDYKLLLIIIIAEVAVLVFLIIATAIVLVIQHKMYDQIEKEYDSYDDYEEDDE